MATTYHSGLLLALLALCAPAGPVSALSASQKSLVIKTHNNLRSKLAKGQALNQNGTSLPKGQNVYELTWSKDAAKTAQAWANGCVFNQSNGQNIYQIVGKKTAYTSALKEALNMWWDELATIGIKHLKFTQAMSESGVANFTQMAWGNTTQVGCGATYCKSKSMTYVVCNYLPAGNIVGKRIYETGSPCKIDDNCSTYDGSTCNRKLELCKR